MEKKPLDFGMHEAHHWLSTPIHNNVPQNQREIALITNKKGLSNGEEYNLDVYPCSSAVFQSPPVPKAMHSCCMSRTRT